MKKHNIFKVVLITIFLLLVLTWILPAAYYSGEYVDQGRVQMGLFDLFNYPLTAVAYFGYISIFIILVGGFYGILYKIPAYRTFLDKIVGFAKGKEKVILSVMIILFAVLTSICGVQFALILFIPFVVSLILLMGYDKIVAALVTVGSISVGLAGSTYAYNNLNVLTSYFNLDLKYQIGVRFVILIAGITLVIFNTLVYIKKSMTNVKIEKKTVKKVEEKEEVVEEKVSTKTVEKVSSKKTSSSKSNAKSGKGKKSTSKSSKSRKSDNKAALKDEDIIVVRETKNDNSYFVPEKVEKKHKIWPFVVTSILLFVLFVLAFITWGENGFGVEAFDKATKSVTEFKLFSFPLFAKLLGTFNSFGNWTITDLFLPMALTILVLTIIYKVKLDDVFDGFIAGAKKALAPAALVILIYSILVIVTYHPFQLVIYKAILGLSKGFNIVTTVFVSILASFFNSDMSYSFQSVIPYYTSVVTNVDNYGTAGIIFQSMYGFTMLFAPTSIVLMAALSYLGISYKEWLKNIWKLLLELFIVLLIVFIILSLI